MKRIGYRDAVARQPDSLADGLASIAVALDGIDLTPFVGKAIGFTGIGASYQAALVGADALRKHGWRSFAFCPTDLYGIERAADAYVALSASGQSREITDIMAARPTTPRVAICRGADNPLATITGAVIPTASDADNGASSTGYTGMLLAIGMLIDRLVGRTGTAWGALPAAVDAVLAAVAEPARRAAKLLAGAASIDLVGAGGAFATAGEGAMLIREAVRIPAAGWDTLNYLHGPMESQDARTGLIAFGASREVRIAQDVAAFGCPSVLITGRPDVPSSDTLVVIVVPTHDDPVAQAIIDIVVMQAIVGEMQDAAGLTNVTFRYRQTDTKLKPWSPTEV